MKIGRCIFVLIPVPRDLHNSAGADRRMWRTADDPKAAHDPPPPLPPPGFITFIRFISNANGK